MSKKKLEELEKRIKELERSSIEHSDPYTVSLNKINTMLRINKIRKDFERQMKELKNILLDKPIKQKERVDILNGGSKIVFSTDEVVSGEKIIYNEIHSEEVVEKLKAENEKLESENIFKTQQKQNLAKENSELREEKEQLKLSLELRNGALKVRDDKIEELRKENESLKVENDKLNLIKYHKLADIISNVLNEEAVKDIKNEAYNQAIDDAIELGRTPLADIKYGCLGYVDIEAEILKLKKK